MKNRLKRTGPAITSRAEMEGLTREITSLTLELNALQIELDHEITAAKGRYEGRIATFTKILNEKLTVAREWAEANPSEFNGKKSIEFLHAVVGWRIGNPTLKTLAGWTWDRVLERLKAIGSCSYVRTKEEVDKQVILADRESIGPERLRDIGCRVIQEESFFVDPKVTEVENRHTVEAGA